MKFWNITNALAFSLMLLIAAPTMAQDEGIKFFHGSWEEALKEAKSEKKVIFVDAYTTWCGPCKMMSRNTFTDKQVGDFFNENFVNLKLDMEKGEGPQFARDYGVNAYPTLLFINHKGNIVHKVVGYRPPEMFLNEGQTAIDPSNNYALLKEEAESGSDNPEVLFNYAAKLKSAGNDYSEYADRYFETQKEKDLLSDQNWKAIMLFTLDIDSREFQSVLDKQAKFEKKFGEDEVRRKIQQVCTASVLNAAQTGDSETYKEALKVSENHAGDDGRSSLFMQMVYTEMQEEWTEYTEASLKYFEKFRGTASAGELNSAGWNFFLHVDDKKKLEKAVSWVKQSIALENEYYNNDTYAALLYKTGQYDAAYKAVNKAIYIAEQSGEDPVESRELLRKIDAKR